MEKLYNKYRFASFDAIIGNLPFINKIKLDIENGAIDHTYLFYGTHGVGKTSMARLIGKSIPNCYIEELNASVENGAEKGKQLAKNAYSIPIGYSSKLVVINEPMRASGNFFDALLEVLEEPGENTYWVITTTEIKKIPGNIKSRFTPIKFESPNIKEMLSYLKKICDIEKINTSNAILKQICINSNNIPRDCFSSLELIRGITNEGEQLSLIGEVGEDKEYIGYKIAKALNDPDWKKLSKLLENVTDNEVVGIRNMVLSYFSTKLLKGGDKDDALLLESFREPFYDKVSLILAVYENC